MSAVSWALRDCANLTARLARLVATASRYAPDVETRDALDDVITELAWVRDALRIAADRVERPTPPTPTETAVADRLVREATRRSHR